MDTKHRGTGLYEAEAPQDWQGKPFRAVMGALHDDLQYFTYRFDDDDLQLITDDPSCLYTS